MKNKFPDLNHGYEPQSKLRCIKISAARDCLPLQCGIIRSANLNAPIVTFRLLAFEVWVSLQLAYSATSQMTSRDL
jgi:hypothetical protein